MFKMLRKSNQTYRHPMILSWQYLENNLDLYKIDSQVHYILIYFRYIFNIMDFLDLDIIILTAYNE